jgi:hypothetical protein
VIVDFEQRWRARRAFFVDPSRRFDPRGWEVSPIADDTTAKRFVIATHYAKSYPAARRRFGLYAPGGSLEGVAVMSVPARPAALLPCPDLSTAVELGRLVLTDRAGFNAETWMIARCFAALSAEGFTGVVSFSDPMPRDAVDGRVVFAGHAGQIYAASNAVYLGQRRAGTLRLLPDGSVFSARAASKVRNRERGWQYALEQLVAAGAPAPVETTRAALARWLSRALPLVTRPRRHPGNHKYVFGLDRATRRALPASLPYPRLRLTRGEV